MIGQAVNPALVSTSAARVKVPTVALGNPVAAVAATSMRRKLSWQGRSIGQHASLLWALTLLAAAIVLAQTASASAEGELTLRGVYYKERATRVEEPILDATSDVGDHGEITGNLAVDVITSASVAAGADAKAFTEKRYEAGGGYSHTIGRYRISGNGRYSTESDYVARYLGAGLTIDLAEKNTQLALGGGHSRDDISNAGAQSPFATLFEGEMKSTMAFLSLTQLVGPNSLVGVSADFSSISGFQSNPYRLAITNQGLISERHPSERLRQAYAVTGRYFLAATATTLIGVYRYYRDDWAVRGHTPEVRVVQEVGDTVEASIRFRYHRQSRAYFYQDRYDTSDVMIQPFLTDDVKLSRFTTKTLEAKLAVHGDTFGIEGRWGAARLEGMLQYVVQDNRFGNAVIAHVAVTVPFGGSY